MFLSAHNYRKCILQAIDGEKSMAIAVAFWGKGSDTMITQCNLSEPRIICNLMTGGTDPKVIANLCAAFPQRVRHSTSLHAKIFVSMSQIIVGSANLSSNGLTNQPDSDGGWNEAGVMLSDPAILESARKWFDNLWIDSPEVRPIDIEEAGPIWLQSRNNRAVHSETRRLSDLPLDEFEDRNIYLAVWSEYPSKKANFVFEARTESLKQEMSEFDANIVDIDFFQNAEEYPTDAVLISARSSKGGKLSIDGAWRRIPQFDQNFLEDDGSSSTLQLVVKQKRILGRLFDSTTQKALAARILKAQSAAQPSSASALPEGVIALHSALSDA